MTKDRRGIFGQQICCLHWKLVIPRGQVSKLANMLCDDSKNISKAKYSNENPDLMSIATSTGTNAWPQQKSFNLVIHYEFHESWAP